MQIDATCTEQCIFKVACLQGPQQRYTHDKQLEVCLPARVCTRTEGMSPLGVKHPNSWFHLTLF